jgi:hypothetical protein
VLSIALVEPVLGPIGRPPRGSGISAPDRTGEDHED